LRGALHDTFDWRTENVAQIVKDQGKCGSSWAFAAIAPQESAWAITFKQLYSVSEQNLLDCVALIAPPDTRSQLPEDVPSIPAPAPAPRRQTRRTFLG
jgi:C1A family cysteine protease